MRCPVAVAGFVLLTACSNAPVPPTATPVPTDAPSVVPTPTEDPRIAKLEKELTETKADLVAANSKASSMETKYKCPNQIEDMQYDDVYDASTALAAWWAKQPHVRKTHTPYRDKIWNNAMTQIHGITFTDLNGEQYVEHFIVYFDEWGMSTGTFWVMGQCWLADGP